MMTRLKDLLGVVVGLGLPASFLYYFCLGPLRRISRARAWQARVCTIVSSDVEQSTSEPGLYGIRITYQYEVAGRVYMSSRYSFSDSASRGGFSAGHRGKKAIVNRLAPGARTVCYVDPEDPSEAVINRAITWDIVVVGMLMALLLIVLAFSVWHDIPSSRAGRPTAHQTVNQ
jgi:hypothetical protein